MQIRKITSYWSPEKLNCEWKDLRLIFEDIDLMIDVNNNIQRPLLRSVSTLSEPRRVHDDGDDDDMMTTFVVMIGSVGRAADGRNLRARALLAINPRARAHLRAHFRNGSLLENTLN